MRPDGLRRPGTAIEDWRLFSPRIDIQTGKQIGFNDPDGKYHALGNDENLVFNQRGDSREPLIRRADGTETPLDEWKEAKLKGEQHVPAELRAKLNTENIKDMIKQTTGQNTRNGGNVVFGNDFSLNDNSREQLKTAIEIGGSLLKQDKEKPEWEALQELIKEGVTKGVLMDLFNFPPKWLVDGGENVRVGKVLLADGQPGIEVPSRMFKVYKWDRIIDHVREIETSNSETLKGRSAKSFGNELTELLNLFRKNGIV